MSAAHEKNLETRLTAPAVGESELAHLANLVPQMIWMCTPDGANIYFNRRWVTYTGMTLEESFGTGWGKPFHPDDRKAAERGWQQAVETGMEYRVESRIRAADGTYRWFLMRGEPCREADGQISKWCGTCTDIHEMKQAEQAMLRGEMLASAGRMAASVAHEINNPLEAVGNLLYLAKIDDDVRSIRRYLEKAEAQLNRVAHIARQSLGFYSESGAPAPCSPRALLTNTIDLLSARIEAKQATIDVRWGDAVQLTGIAGELRQVFANLLVNSLEAIPVGGTIKIRTLVEFDRVQQRRRFRITIADNGRGIPRAIRTQIFEPFFTTKGSVGTGLGLWVCKQILDKHHGAIQIRSKADGLQTGTVFRITFPEQDFVLRDTRASKPGGAGKKKKAAVACCPEPGMAQLT